MAKLTLEIITGEKRLFRGEEIDEVVAPGAVGELGVLPNHAALVTSLKPGALIVKRGAEEEPFFVSGGFLEVKNNLVTVLADSAERGEEIDLERAQAARGRAEQRLRHETDFDRARAQAAFQRSLIRVKVAERRRRRRGDLRGGEPPGR